MQKPIQFLTALAFTLVLAACGSVHNYVVVAPENLGELKQLTVVPGDVTSQEQTAEAIANNEKLKAMAVEEMQSMLAGKGRASSSGAQGTVCCKIAVVYGSRSLRYWVGFGAGSGHITVNIELKDNSGKVRYAMNSESDLSVGAFGGNMEAVARKTVKKAAEEFAKKL